MSRVKDDPNLQILYDVKHKLDHRMSSLEQSTLINNHNLEMAINTLNQKVNDENRLIHDKIDKLINNVDSSNNSTIPWWKEIIKWKPATIWQIVIVIVAVCIGVGTLYFFN